MYIRQYRCLDTVLYRQTGSGSGPGQAGTLTTNSRRECVTRYAHTLM